MKIDDLDEWYDDKKQEIFDTYIEELDTKEVKKDVAEEKFHNKMKILKQDYEKKFNDSEEKEKKRKKFKKKIDPIKRTSDKITEFVSKIVEVYK